MKDRYILEPVAGAPEQVITANAEKTAELMRKHL